MTDDSAWVVVPEATDAVEPPQSVSESGMSGPMESSMESSMEIQSEEDASLALALRLQEELNAEALTT